MPNRSSAQPPKGCFHCFTRELPWLSQWSYLYQQLLRLYVEASVLDAAIKAAVGEMKAAAAEGDRAMYREVWWQTRGN